MGKSVKISLLLAMSLFLAGCAQQLETGLSEDDAQRIVVLLRENGINAIAAVGVSAKKGTDAWTVSVRGQSDTLVRAWKLLDENGMPRKSINGLDSVYANAGIIPTASEEKARLLSGLDGEMTQTLDSISGVTNARVQVVLPDNNPLLERSQQTQPTASVLIQYTSDQEPLKLEEVQNLVARGIEGLSPNNVGVVFKKIVVTPIPPQALGPLSVKGWLEVAALGFAATASLASLLVFSLSQQRKYKIKALERQLLQAKGLTVDATGTKV